MCTLTKAPGMGGLHGKNNGRPSSSNPMKRLQTGLLSRSGRLFPTRTTTVAGWSPVETEHTYYLGEGEREGEGEGEREEEGEWKGKGEQTQRPALDIN